MWEVTQVSVCTRVCTCWSVFLVCTVIIGTYVFFPNLTTPLPRKFIEYLAYRSSFALFKAKIPIDKNYRWPFIGFKRTGTKGFTEQTLDFALRSNPHSVSGTVLRPEALSPRLGFYTKIALTFRLSVPQASLCTLRGTHF